MSVPGPKPDLQAVSTRTTELLAELWQAISAAARARGLHPLLSPSQARALQVIVDNDGITPAELSHLLEMSRPQISDVLRRLEDSAFVLRIKSSTDGRSYNLTPTARGIAALDDLRRASATTVAEAFSAMDDGDLRSIASSLPALSRLAAQVLAIAESDAAS